MVAVLETFRAVICHRCGKPIRIPKKLEQRALHRSERQGCPRPRERIRANASGNADAAAELAFPVLWRVAENTLEELEVYTNSKLHCAR